jgi:hypothetical protein
MSLPGSTPIFSIGDEGFDWGDVKAAAIAWGEWGRVEDQVRAGVASLRFLEADEREIDPGRVEASAEEFREERNLLAAEEMNRWLAERGLEVEEWLGFIERSLARKMCVAEVGEIVRDFPVDETEIGAAADCEAICSGIAGDAARMLAAAASVSPAADGDRPRQITSLTATLEQVRREAADIDGISRLLDSRRLDWTAVECRLAAFSDDDSAREAALCIREEGEDLGQVARGSGTREERTVFLLQDLEPELQAPLLSAESGHLLGPLLMRGRPTLVIVVAKRPPDASDPGLRARAEQALFAAMIERHARIARFLLEL